MIDQAGATALQYIAVMQQSQVIDLDSALALRAASLGIRHKLPWADSVVHATAQAAQATLWTQDADFDSLPDVRYFAKTSP
ncbi:MAG: PIN domain-containing protein [Chiayiivirga sp.]|jgi:predicted nucleic acid-binding protein|uniref:PIN domain-containing protein n=1 Tax=Chiayiivirga sp. TaxID=2041042 RepID=UPI0025C171CF|nr:PIN domain-containing protein [Chiayiivirga sp.]MCI1711966.1 PIN domain-containing protein [Chiayiivirga sp.]MCI1729437.1 PIN domain-containing protein [Chiayiivirga sp.]